MNRYLRNTIKKINQDPVGREVVRAIRLLSGPYVGLVSDVRLESRFASVSPPPVHIIAEDSEYIQLEVENLQIWWPKLYPHVAVPSMYNEIFGSPEWNPHCYEHGEVKIAKDSWVVDAGSCEGFFIHYALSCGAKVLAVEPVPLLARALERTFEAEILDQRVKVIHGALGSTSGEIRMEIPQNMVYCASISQTGTYTVPVYRIDDLVDNGVVPDIDFVKMDIEGGEIEAIRGARNLLHKRRPKLSIAVYHAKDNAYIVKRLIQIASPEYKVQWRGLWIRGNDAPRPYMLYASEP